MENRQKIKNFIKKRAYLAWYVKDVTQLSDESIVEHTLNYGNWDDVQTLFKILGIKKTAKIFRKQISGWRTNYDKKVKNYFSLYFNNYAKTA